MKKFQVFTPSQYVEQMLDSVDYQGDIILKKYFLENSVGEGNILLIAVERYIQSAQSADISPRELKKDLEQYFIGYEVDKSVKMCIESILPESDYSGENFLNPYKLLKNYSVTDRLLAAWLSVIITPLEKESRENTIFSFDYELRHIIQLWKPLLDSKFISIYEDFTESKISLDNFNQLDLFLILNNFILNSAYYLEEKDSGERRINISLVETQNLIILELSNNGKELSERYKTNPNYILKPGITTKPENEGTGLGLWILNEAVERNGGRTEVIADFEGFKIKIIFSKQKEL